MNKNEKNYHTFVNFLKASTFSFVCTRIDDSYVCIKYIEKTVSDLRPYRRNITDIRNVRSTNEAIDSHIRRAPAINNSPGPINAIVQRRVTKVRSCECVSVAACACYRHSSDGVCMYLRARKLRYRAFQSEGETLTNRCSHLVSVCNRRARSTDRLNRTTR